MLEINLENYESKSSNKEVLTKEFLKLSAKNLSYQDFFKDFMLQNVPCLIKDAIDEWPASKDFITSNGQPNLDFLDHLFEEKNTDVPVSNCSEKYFNAQEKCSMTWSEYKAYWNGPRSNILYLKDWHLPKQCFPNYKFYQTPHYFGSDWLNEYWNEIGSDDYKFTYLGPQGSWTPFHTDVYGSFSWSANVAGYKKWIFFPKDKEPKNIYDIQELLPDVNESFHLKNYNNLEYFVITQGPKEIIFVPSGWYHQVFNVTDTLSINHNWFNATNLKYVWSQLHYELTRVQAELQDCFEENNEEWKDMCQNLLLASHGMNYTMFIDLLSCVYRHRVSNVGKFDGWTYGETHIKFDLSEIHSVVKEMIKSSSHDLLKSDMSKAVKLIHSDDR